MSFYEKTGSSAASGSHRRTWDKDYYKMKANERAAKEQEESVDLTKKGRKAVKFPDGVKPPPPKKLLEARDYKVDLESKIGKSVVISKTATSADTGGYYCDICDCMIKDSINFLDHINGKNHQRNMGFSMKVKRSTADEVREKLARKKDELEKSKRNADNTQDEDIREEEAKLADMKRQKREQKSRKRPAAEEEEPQQDDEFAKLMGFGGFGGSKKNN